MHLYEKVFKFDIYIKRGTIWNLVCLQKELVNQLIASYDAKANLKAIQIQADIFENTLDIFT